MVQWKMEGCMLEYKLVTVMTTAQAPPSHCFSNPALVTCPGLGCEIASFWNNKRSCWRWNSVWCSGKWKDACLYIYYHVYLTLAHMFHFLKEVAPTPIRLVYVIFWPSFRTAFIARTGFLIMLPSVRRLGHCVMSVIGEFVSIAVTWICSMFFFLVG